MANAGNIKLRPFRDYDEKDVINLYALKDDSVSLPIVKGTLVKFAANAGWNADQELSMLGDVGASYTNVTSQRYGVAANVAVAGEGDTPLGMMLHDVRETDENGEQLKFNPRKAAEMEAVISGQAIPLVSKGIFLYYGTGLAAETPVAGTDLYVHGNGQIETGTHGSAKKVGFALGNKDRNSNVLIKLDCDISR
jgi:hypothetical protein